MAIDVEIVPPVTPVVTAAADLRTHQRKFVTVAAAGVNLADVRSAVTGAVYVLENAPNTNENATCAQGPNIRKVIAAEAIGLGQIVMPFSATGLACVTSGGNVARVGVAWQAATASGELFAVKLF